MLPARDVRLTEPYLRENGGYRRATWDEALDRVATGFKNVLAAHGSNQVGVFCCSKTTNELNFLAQKFARVVLGTNNVDSCSRNGHAPSVAGLAQVFGFGGGTSSHSEIEETDLVLLWGSNALEAHPIFFHHLLKGLKRGAKFYVVDSRRSSSTQWADAWLSLDVGTDIALANAMGREIIAAGLIHVEFVTRATRGFEEYRASVESCTLECAERETGVPAKAIRDAAHAYARAPRAQLCWTLEDSEHPLGVEKVLALINLALLTGHVGRYGSGLTPLRAQNNVQGGGDMGLLPDRLPGFQRVDDDACRAKFESAWRVKLPAQPGLNLNGMFSAMERGRLHALYVLGENPAQSESDRQRAVKLLQGLDFLVVQDILFSATAELADVILPAAAGWCESEGTVTSCERRVQRVQRTLSLPSGARDDIDIVCELAHRFGFDWGPLSPETIWDELRSLSPMHGGMSYARLESCGGIRWPCYDQNHPGELFLHARLWESPVVGEPAPFQVMEYTPPVEPLSLDFPIRLTTQKRRSAFPRGVSTAGTVSRQRKSNNLEISPEDAARLGVAEGETVRLVSRCGEMLLPVRLEGSLRLGLACMTGYGAEQSAGKFLATAGGDQRSMTSEFRTAAIRVEKMVTL